MTDFILYAVILVAWLTYNLPPLANSKSEAAQVAHGIIGAVLSCCAGLGFGHHLGEVFLR